MIKIAAMAAVTSHEGDAIYYVELHQTDGLLAAKLVWYIRLYSCRTAIELFKENNDKNLNLEELKYFSCLQLSQSANNRL